MLEFIYLFLNLNLIVSLFVLLRAEEFDAQILFFCYAFVNLVLFGFQAGYIDFSIVNTNSFNLDLFVYYKMKLVVLLDQCSLLFIMLTTLLFLVSTVSGWVTIRFEKNFIYSILLVLEYILITFFLSFDMFYFYILFEATVIPMFIIIIMWGVDFNRVRAGFYLLCYTTAFSTPLLLIILHVHTVYGTTNMVYLFNETVLSPACQVAALVAFMFSFGVKLPIYPLHLWLPEAHVEAPTSGSMILAGILLKIGYYGFLRFLPWVYSYALHRYVFICGTICLVGSIYSALIAIHQLDFKRVIAYSSVSHMSFCLLGFMSGKYFGIMGSILMSVGHGLISVALFLLVGLIYERTHTKLINLVSGISEVAPTFSGFLLLSLISNFSFPITLNFISELLILIGIGSWNILVAFVLIFYSVLSVAYNLWLFLRTSHGALSINLFIRCVFNDLSKTEVSLNRFLCLINMFLCYVPNILIKNLISFTIVTLSFFVEPSVTLSIITIFGIPLSEYKDYVIGYIKIFFKQVWEVGIMNSILFTDLLRGLFRIVFNIKVFEIWYSNIFVIHNPHWFWGTLLTIIIFDLPGLWFFEEREHLEFLAEEDRKEEERWRESGMPEEEIAKRRNSFFRNLFK